MRHADRAHNTFDASRFVTRECLLPDALSDPERPFARVAVIRLLAYKREHPNGDTNESLTCSDWR